MNKQSRRWWHTPLGVLALFCLIVIATVWDGVHFYLQFHLELNDFGRFYYGAQYFMEGNSLYDASPATPVTLKTGEELQLWNLGTPAFHFLFLPLTYFSANQALSLWWGASLFSLAWSIRAITLEMRWQPSPADWFLFIGLILTANATAAQIVTGQMGLLILAPVTWAWIQARSNNYKQVGIALGALAALKPTMLIFFPWLLMRALWRPRNTVGVVAFCASFILTTTLALAVFGLDEHFAWFRTVRSLDWAWLPMNASIQGWATRAFSENPMFPYALSLPVLVKPLWLLLSSIIGLFTYYRIKGATADTAFAALLVLALLVAPLGWLYYLFVLIGPVAGVWSIKRPPPRMTTVMAIALFTPYALTPYLSVNTPLTVLVGALSMTGLFTLWAWILQSASHPSTS